MVERAGSCPPLNPSAHPDRQRQSSYPPIRRATTDSGQLKQFLNGRKRRHPMATPLVSSRVEHLVEDDPQGRPHRSGTIGIQRFPGGPAVARQSVMGEGDSLERGPPCERSKVREDPASRARDRARPTNARRNDIRPTHQWPRSPVPRTVAANDRKCHGNICSIRMGAASVFRRWRPVGSSP